MNSLRYSIVLVFVTSAFQLVFTLQQPPNTRDVQVFVNVYDHPKTGFSCLGKNPGEYYADPATKCAVYYVCLQNPTGTLSPQSFACPNGTIFSQATRVCRPHEEAYCPLATRYYDSIQGVIDSKLEGDYELPQLPIAPQNVVRTPVPIENPAQLAPQINRSRPTQRAQARPLPQPAPAPSQSQPQPQPQSSQFNNAFNSANRFRNTRAFQHTSNLNPTAATTTTTTTTTTVRPQLGANINPTGLADYEYDYSDYNETNHAPSSAQVSAAASALHAQILENVRENIAQEKAIEDGNNFKIDKVQFMMDTPLNEAASSNIPVIMEPIAEQSETKARTKRASDLMLSRRKGQLSTSLLEALSKLEQLEAQLYNSIEFTCEDKSPGAAYADIASGCDYYYICMEVSKGKLVPYRFECGEGKQFNQAVGYCDKEVTDKSCSNSDRYFLYNKLFRPSKKHFLETSNKQETKSKEAILDAQ